MALVREENLMAETASSGRDAVALEKLLRCPISHQKLREVTPEEL
jgi:hypothetical protein